MSILIQKAGILTTVQDLGRFGYRRLGINPGGAMDRTAARLINILLGNAESDGVLEMHFPAGEIVFESECVFAVGGAEFTPQLDGKTIDNWSSYSARPGSVLRFKDKQVGNRTYFAIRGGFAIDKWLGSVSTNLSASASGIEGRKLQSEDRLEIRESENNSAKTGRRIAPALIPDYSSFPTVRVIAGAEFDLLDDKSRSRLTASTFTLSNNSNRMGFRLDGELLSLRQPLEMISSATSFGTIQLLPDGQLIVLMADHQTSGGYPRVAHVIEVDLPVISQLGSRDQLTFHLVSLADAEALNAEHERDMALFSVGCGSHSKS